VDIVGSLYRFHGSGLSARLGGCFKFGVTAMANRPRDLADQMAGQHNLNNGPLHETFTLSVEAARLKAREIIDQIPHGGYMAIVQHWRQLPDGQIEFATCRLRTAD
jgi:hypothetical protein